MMNDLQYTFYRNSSGSFLVITAAEIEEGYIRKMLETKEIPFLLEEHIVRLGRECELRYRISGMQTLEKRFSVQKMRTEDITLLIDRIIRVRDACASCLLPEEHLFLSPDLIYVPLSGEEFRFLYLPEAACGFEEQIRQLADFLMKRVSYDQSEDEAVEVVYALQDAAGRDGFDLKIWWKDHRPKGHDSKSGGIFAQTVRDISGPEYHGINSNETLTETEMPEMSVKSEKFSDTDETDFSGTDFGFETWEQLWKADPFEKSKPEKRPAAFFGWILNHFGVKKREERTQGKKRKRSGTREEKEQETEGKKQSKEQEKKRRQQKKHHSKKEENQDKGKPRSQEDLFSEKVYFSQIREEGTVCLSDVSGKSQVPYPQAETHALIPMNGGKEIPIDRPFLLVGTSERNVDIVLRDHTVSRVHAEIFCDEDGVRIEDCNSSNGTQVDGQMLGPNEQKTLQTGMHIRLGGSEFVFR